MGKKEKARAKLLYAEEAPRVAIERKINPKSNVKTQLVVDPARQPPDSLAMLEDILRKQLKGKAVETTALEEMIYKLARQQVPYREIAAQLGMDPENVRKIHQDMLTRENTYSTSEMRLVITDQIRALMNRLWEMINNGGTAENSPMLLRCIKELGAIHSVTENQSKIEINVLQKSQKVVIISATDAAITHVLSDPDVRAALPPARVNQLLGEALGKASGVVQEMQNETVVIEAGKV